MRDTRNPIIFGLEMIYCDSNFWILCSDKILNGHCTLGNTGIEYIGELTDLCIASKNIHTRMKSLDKWNARMHKLNECWPSIRYCNRWCIRGDLAHNAIYDSCRHLMPCFLSSSKNKEICVSFTSEVPEAGSLFISSDSRNHQLQSSLPARYIGFWIVAARFYV